MNTRSFSRLFPLIAFLSCGSPQSDELSAVSASGMMFEDDEDFKGEGSHVPLSAYSSYGDGLSTASSYNVGPTGPGAVGGWDPIGGFDEGDEPADGVNYSQRDPDPFGFSEIPTLAASGGSSGDLFGSTRYGGSQQYGAGQYVGDQQYSAGQQYAGSQQYAGYQNSDAPSSHMPSAYGANPHWVARSSPLNPPYLYSSTSGSGYLYPGYTNYLYPGYTNSFNAVGNGVAAPPSQYGGTPTYPTGYDLDPTSQFASASGTFVPTQALPTYYASTGLYSTGYEPDPRSNCKPEPAPFVPVPRWLASPPVQRVFVGGKPVVVVAPDQNSDPDGDATTEREAKLKFEKLSKIPFDLQTTKTLFVNESSGFRGEWLSRQEFPIPPGERLTFVLAGRGKEARLPVESAGGRVVLIASERQRRDAADWVRSNVDVFIVDDLAVQGCSLQNYLDLVTPRRLAAFALADLAQTSVFAVVDDNIEGLTMASSVVGSAPTWSDIFIASSQIIRAYDASMLGFRSTNAESDKLVGSNPQWNLVSHNKTIGVFGEKVFFYNRNNIASVFSGVWSLLLPPSIFLDQEDVYVQLVLEKFMPGSVFHFDRSFGEIIPSKQMSLTMRRARDGKLQFDDWKSFHNNKIAAINEVAAVMSSLPQRDRRGSSRQCRSSAAKVPPPDIKFLGKHDRSGRSEDTEDSSKRRKANDAEVSSSSSTTGQKPEVYARFGELDATSERWANFVNFLREPPNLGFELWRHQRAALEHLASTLEPSLSKSSAQTGHLFPVYSYGLATGAGKSRIILEMITAAQKSLKGNIAVVSPHCELLKQIKKVLAARVVEDLAVSSIRGNVNAATGASNQDIARGENLVYFVEKSFNNFIVERNYNLRDFSLVIFDESHLMKEASETWTEAINNRSPGLIAGFSATPSDEGPLATAPGYTYSTEEAVAEGHLVKWETKTLDVNIKLIRSELPHILNGSVRHNDGKTLLDHRGVVYIPAMNIQKLKILEHELIEKHHLPVQAFHSTLSDGEKDATIENFRSGRTKVLIAIRTLREGFDVPAMDYVVVVSAKHPKNFPALIQMRGRALRRDPENADKTALLVTTFPVHPASPLRYHPVANPSAKTDSSVDDDSNTCP